MYVYPCKVPPSKNLLHQITMTIFAECDSVNKYVVLDMVVHYLERNYSVKSTAKKFNTEPKQLRD